MTPAEEGRALGEFDILLHEDHVGTGFLARQLGVSSFVLVPKDTVYRGTDLHGGSVGQSLVFVLSLFNREVVQFFPEELIFLVEVVELLLELGQVVSIGLLLHPVEFFSELGLFHLAVVDLPGDLLVAFLAGPLLLTEVEFVLAVLEEVSWLLLVDQTAIQKAIEVSFVWLMSFVCFVCRMHQVLLMIMRQILLMPFDWCFPYLFVLAIVAPPLHLLTNNIYFSMKIPAVTPCFEYRRTAYEI